MEAHLGKTQKLSITAKLYLQLFLQDTTCWRHQSSIFSTTTEGCYNTLVFVAPIDKDATTPYFPATTRRMLQTPCRIAAFPSTTLPP